MIVEIDEILITSQFGPGILHKWFDQPFEHRWHFLIVVLRVLRQIQLLFVTIPIRVANSGAHEFIRIALQFNQ